jgi:hypothetical protein
MAVGNLKPLAVLENLVGQASVPVELRVARHHTSESPPQIPSDEAVARAQTLGHLN